jgi:RNA polymerase sigma-70 factor, ECF subfamily
MRSHDAALVGADRHRRAQPLARRSGQSRSNARWVVPAETSLKIVQAFRHRFRQTCQVARPPPTDVDARVGAAAVTRARLEAPSKQMNATPGSTDADGAFDALVEKLSGRLALFLAQLVRDRDLAQDLLQDTLLAAYTSREQLGDVSNHEAWLFGIARNRALNANRRRQRGRRALERLLLVRREVVSDPADAAATRDLLERYLDANERALLILRYLHGFDSQELSEVFRMSPEAIRQRLSRLRRRLRLAARPAAAGHELRPRGPDVQRYAQHSVEELETDLAFERLLGPLAEVQPALPPRRATGRRRFWLGRRH